MFVCLVDLLIISWRFIKIIMVEIIPEEEVVDKKDKFGYKIPDVVIDKEMSIKIKYGMLKISIDNAKYIQILLLKNWIMKKIVIRR